MKGISKIQKFLETQGYKVSYEDSEVWRYGDSFHKGSTFIQHLYSINNGMYFRAKEQGKRRYYLYRDKEAMQGNRPCMLNFTQEGFVTDMKKYFPKRDGDTLQSVSDV